MMLIIHQRRSCHAGSTLAESVIVIRLSQDLHPRFLALRVVEWNGQR
jgi:hypothetical protein